MRTSVPNIVFIITDQQRFDTISALGYGHVGTPNLDRLVREGVAFSRTFVTAPSCAPSRASLFTGLYPHNTKVLRNNEAWRYSWVEDIAAAGYRCVNVGKMHTYPYDTPFGFHERHVVENKDRANPILPFFLDDWDKALWIRNAVKPDRETLRALPDYRERLGAFEWTLPEDLHPDVFVGNLAKKWLDAYPGVEPFFLQVGFPGPHPPYSAVDRHVSRYDGRRLPSPIRTRRDIDDQPEPLKELRRNHLENDHDAVVHLDDPTPEQMRRQRAHYFANISMIDEQVGEIMDALDRRGVLEDTVVVFTSDHGEMLGDHGHSQKWTMYEPSIRVPGIVWAPGAIAGGRVVDSLISHMDLGATILEFAGVERPEWMESRSVMPALLGQEWAGREHVFAEHARDRMLSGTELMTMVRDDRWKLVEFVDSDAGQLFDLADDPDEEWNLWADPAHEETKARLAGVISRWRAESSLVSAPMWVSRRQ